MRWLCVLALAVYICIFFLLPLIPPFPLLCFLCLYPPVYICIFFAPLECYICIPSSVGWLSFFFPPFVYILHS